jgi:hypothetical protein
MLWKGIRRYRPGVAGTVFGTLLSGRIYREGRRPIATTFIHVCRVPLIPLGTVEILDEEAGIASPTAFSAASLFAGYFKTWGAVFAVAISVWAFVELTTGEEVLAYLLPFASLGAMASVIAAWLWLGSPRAVRIKTSALAFGVPLALMVGAYAYGFVRRMPSEPLLEPIVELPNPAEVAAEKRIVERSIQRSKYQDMLYPIARSHYAKKTWSKAACNDRAIAAAPEAKATELLLIEYNFIGKILNPVEDRPTMRPWLVSEPLRDLGIVDIPDGTFDTLASHRYIGVISVRQERKLNKRRSIIAGHLVVYDWSNGQALCETPVKVTGPGKPGGLRRKFLRRIEHKLGEISRTLHVERPTPLL